MSGAGSGMPRLADVSNGSPRCTSSRSATGASSQGGGWRISGRGSPSWSCSTGRCPPVTSLRQSRPPDLRPFGRDGTVPWMTADFERLLSAAQDGDAGSFVTLFRSIQPALLRYLSTLGGSLADDVAGDTWVSVVRGLHRFSGDEAGWRAWVFTIAHARLRDAQRRAVRDSVLVVGTESLEDRAASIDVADDVEEVFSTEAALALINMLPTEKAEV